MAIPLNASSVYVSWIAPNVPSISHYTVYYNRTIDNALTLNLSNSSTLVVITDLTTKSTQYEFRISVTIGEFEGPLSAVVKPGNICNLKLITCFAVIYNNEINVLTCQLKLCSITVIHCPNAKILSLLHVHLFMLWCTHFKNKLVYYVNNHNSFCLSYRSNSPIC